MSLFDLHSNASAKVLGFCRMALYGIWLAILIQWPIPHLANLPYEWSNYWGPLRFMPDSVRLIIHTYAFYSFVYYLAIVLSLLLILGVRPFKPLAFTFAIVVLIYDLILKSFCGFPNHAQLASLYAVFIMALYPAADGFSIAGEKKTLPREDCAPYKVPIISISIAFCLAYMFIGVRRFARGGFEIFLGDAMPTYQAVQSIHYSNFGFEYGLLVLSTPILFTISKFGFFAMTFFEALSPLVIFNKWFRYAWICAMIGLHALALFTMNILFWENTILILVFFTPLPYWITCQRQ